MSELRPLEEGELEEGQLPHYWQAPTQLPDGVIDAILAQTQEQTDDSAQVARDDVSVSSSSESEERELAILMREDALAPATLVPAAMAVDAGRTMEATSSVFATHAGVSQPDMQSASLVSSPSPYMLPAARVCI